MGIGIIVQRLLMSAWLRTVSVGHHHHRGKPCYQDGRIGYIKSYPKKRIIKNESTICQTRRICEA